MGKFQHEKKQKLAFSCAPENLIVWQFFVFRPKNALARNDPEDDFSWQPVQISDFRPILDMIMSSYFQSNLGFARVPGRCALSGAMRPAHFTHSCDSRRLPYNYCTNDYAARKSYLLGFDALCAVWKNPFAPQKTWLLRKILNVSQSKFSTRTLSVQTRGENVHNTRDYKGTTWRITQKRALCYSKLRHGTFRRKTWLMTSAGTHKIRHWIAGKLRVVHKLQAVEYWRQTGHLFFLEKVFSCRS